MKKIIAFIQKIIRKVSSYIVIGAKAVFNFIKKNRLIISLWLILIALFVFGGMYGRYASETMQENKIINEQRYYDLVDLVSIEYNLDPDTFVEKPFIATAVYDGETYQMYLNNEFCFVEMISDHEPSKFIESAIKHHAEQEDMISNRAYFVSYDETTRVLEMEAIGFVGTPIEITIVLNADLDGVESFSVISYENYENEYNSAYTGDAAPAVENQMLNDYISGGIPVDTVAGASVGTGAAMRDVISMLDMFIDSLNGGAANE